MRKLFQILLAAVILIVGIIQVCAAAVVKKFTRSNFNNTLSPSGFVKMSIVKFQRQKIAKIFPVTPA